jgi:hypothetical protein
MGRPLFNTPDAKVQYIHSLLEYLKLNQIRRITSIAIRAKHDLIVAPSPNPSTSTINRPVSYQSPPEIGKAHRFAFPPLTEMVILRVFVPPDQALSRATW